MILLLLAALLSPPQAPIGSRLTAGIELVYQSDGTPQPAWVYDSVRVLARADYPRCVAFQRRGEPVRESCERGDTVFDLSNAGVLRPSRPIAPGASFASSDAAGSLHTYVTGPVEMAEVAGLGIIEVVPTTITTTDATGAVTRRLRERYAPELLTALGGMFEEPLPDGGWRILQEFSLREARMPKS